MLRRCHRDVRLNSRYFVFRPEPVASTTNHVLRRRDRNDNLPTVNMTTNESNPEDGARTIEAEDYDFQLPPHLAPRLVRVLDQVKDADSPMSAVFYGEDDCEDIAEMYERLEGQLREQGYTGRI